MHKLNIFISGSESFKSTLDELKSYFKFNIISNQKNFSEIKKIDGIICDEEIDFSNHEKKYLIDKDCFKIIAIKKDKIKTKNCDYVLKLPASIEDINSIIEKSAAKKKFNKNSSISIKGYLLDKNEKKLINGDSFIILTEKEIHLLEILLNKKKPIPKADILSFVWHYSSDADTHTVETHIYRLRKKINEMFSDEKFILNNKDGYYL